ncbi:thymidylate synthase [Loktanella salsilacus]|uniref:thymidylate synthase n=1 Tax=Loktanella salsilacus TaxID=195913 RepID=UPI003703EBC2
MEIEGSSLDRILIQLYKALLEKGRINREASRGPNKELLGLTIRLTNPLSRLSRSEDRGRPFSALGELLWYLTGSDSLYFIHPYISAYEKESLNGVLPGAYGPRLFNMRGQYNQLENIIKVLTKSPGSRRAVIQLFDASDIQERLPEIPCTTTMQFHVRDGKLYLSVTMRSNDAYLGFPHDVFCFTMLQEMVARKLGLELGDYIHHAGSMHIYTDREKGALEYIEEGFQKPIYMPRMPDGDPFELVEKIKNLELRLRRQDNFDAQTEMESDYWSDFMRLLQVFWAKGDIPQITSLLKQFKNSVYRSHLEGRLDTMKRKAEEYTKKKDR